jgi:hypothetical protein
MEMANPLFSPLDTKYLNHRNGKKFIEKRRTNVIIISKEKSKRMGKIIPKNRAK